MAYERFSENSDIYLYMGEPEYVCCCCGLTPIDKNGMHADFITESTQEVIDHLRKHESAGHRFDDDVYAQLEAEL